MRSDRYLVRSWEIQAGFKRTACLDMDKTGTRESHRSLGRWPSILTEWSVVLRNGNASVAVGLTHSTPSAGKPRTWGRGGTRDNLERDTLSALRGGSQ
jgi:hypothetical protein